VCVSKRNSLCEVLGTPDNGGSASPGDGRLEVIDTRKVQSRKPVTQVQVLESKQLMLCLADASVCVYSLPTFELQGNLTRSKGCNLFDWNDSRGVLCVATKRRLLLYHYDGRNFVELKEIPMNDIVRCLAWCGDAICLGLRKEYVLVNAATGINTDVFPTGKSSTPNILPVPPPLTPGPGGFGASGDSGDAEELLLARDNVGIFVGAGGKPTRKHGLPWTETPSATVGFPPYAVAALTNSFEVRNLQRGSQHSLAQTLPLRGVLGVVAATDSVGRGVKCSASSEGDDVVLYAFTATSVVRLTGVPIPSQVAQLLDTAQFEVALLLCELLAAAPSLRAELTETAHRRCAHHRFHGGLYDDAMRHFGAGGASPLEVLALFPGLLPPALAAVAARHGHQSRVPPSNTRHLPPTLEDWPSSSQEALSALLPFLIGTRMRLRDASSSSSSLLIWGPDDEEAVALDTATLCVLVTTDAPREAVLELLEPPTAVHPAAGEQMLVDAGRYAELVTLHLSLGQHRRALELLQRLATSASGSTSGRGSSRTFGPHDTVRYLREIRPSDPLLTLEFSRWVLREQPGVETLELFTTADPPLPVEDVLPHLRMHAAQLCVPYLEHEMAARGAELPVAFHDDLVLLYLADLTRARAVAGVEHWNEESSMPDVRLRLLTLLQAPAATSRYNPERMLSRFPQDALFEERAILLSRVGRHEEALAILVRRLNNSVIAEAYCDRVWRQAPVILRPGDLSGGGGVVGELDEWLAVNEDVVTDADNVYHCLLRVYLEQPQDPATAAAADKRASSLSSSRGWLSEALELLTRRHQYIDGKKAVELLPDNVPLREVMPFLEAKMLSSAQLRHKLERHERLLQSQHDEAEEAIRKFKSQSFVVTEEATCAICQKRLNSSVFAVHPDGSLVHFSCLNR